MTIQEKKKNFYIIFYDESYPTEILQTYFLFEN